MFLQTYPSVVFAVIEKVFDQATILCLFEPKQVHSDCFGGFVGYN